MKETIKVMGLFVLIFLIALTPWLLLRQESQSPDDTVHRVAVPLVSPEIAEEMSADADLKDRASTVEEKLRIMRRAAVDTGTYSISSVNWDALDLTLLGDAVRSQMEALLVHGVLPSVDMGGLRGVEPMDQVTFYDPQDAIETVQIMTMYLVYDNCLVFAAMDLESNLFYAVSLPQAFDLASDWLPTNVQPTAFLAYLGVEEPMEISITNLSDGSGFFGTLVSSDDPDLLISFEVTRFQIGYSPEALDYMGLMQY